MTGVSYSQSGISKWSRGNAHLYSTTPYRPRKINKPRLHLFFHGYRSCAHVIWWLYDFPKPNSNETSYVLCDSRKIYI